MRAFTSLVALAALVGINTVASHPAYDLGAPKPAAAATPTPPGGAKPHGYKSTPADQKWANDQIAVLKPLTCCKNKKCEQGSPLHKVYQAMMAPGLTKYRLGYIEAKMMPFFSGKPDAKGTPPAPKPAGAPKNLHRTPEYKLAVLKMLNITLHTMAHAKTYPPGGEHSIKHVKRIIGLLKFKNPSMKPADANAQKALAKSILRHLRRDPYAQRIILHYKFETAVDAAIAALKTKTTDAIHQDLTTALDTTLVEVNKKRAEKKLPAIVFKKAGAPAPGTPAPATGTPAPATGTPAPGTPAPGTALPAAPATVAAK